MMPISTPGGKSNAAPPGQSKYYKNYMTPHTSGVVPGAITTGAPPPGTLAPGHGGYFPQPDPAEGKADSGGTSGQFDEGHPFAKPTAADYYPSGMQVPGTSYAQQAYSMGGQSPELEQYLAFTGGQQLTDMEEALADQYDKMLAQQLGEQTSQQQAAEDMLRAQSMQMGIGGSPGGALSDWAGVQSQGAKDRAQVKLAHEAASSNARLELENEYTRLNTAQRQAVDDLSAGYADYFNTQLRDNAIGESATNLNPEFEDDLSSLYQLLSMNSIPMHLATPMIDDLVNTWVSSGVASFFQNANNQYVYPGMLAKLGATTTDAYWRKDDAGVAEAMAAEGYMLPASGHLVPGMKFKARWFGATAHLNKNEWYDTGPDSVEMYPPDYTMDPSSPYSGNKEQYWWQQPYTYY